MLANGFALSAISIIEEAKEVHVGICPLRNIKFVEQCTTTLVVRLSRE